ncbi:PREDICTED: calumenin [Ipomoea nil]|uniref:calumenin n=1 Tax=Ipomoea nil TaxID=35883 RepID=UPI000901CC6A|nr:PREDICTED: calumenin [Ipomoea nil]XP_019163689.1 PREDICTED: calumenin [Ipomoea nil]
MGKASVIVYITIAVLLLLLISQSPNKGNKHRRHRRLKLRSNFTFSPPADGHLHHHDRIHFDPIVADIERKREDKEWEKMYIETHHPELKSSEEHAPGEQAQPEWEDFIDAEDYLNDEEKFNVTNRLVMLFPKIDIDPPDGYVSERELTQWNLEQSRRDVLHRTEREMETHDKNRDGFVSFAEYEPPTWVQKSESNSVGYDMGWWKEEHFNASDMDGDGLLNITEFNDFLHPADSTNPKLLLWLCKEEIRERDSDKDGKVNFNEFFHGLFDLVRNYDEEGHNTSHHSDDSGSTPARKLFDELDKDGDGFLSDVELLPIIEKLHPSERYYAKQQADYIIQQADSDKDGRLTLSEMIDSPYVFYSAIFNEDEESDYEEYHDEFR